jgi:hypothetical protein
LNLDEAFSNREAAVHEINAFHAEGAKLSGTESCHRSNEDHRPEPRIDGVGEGLDLFAVEKTLLVVAVGRKGDPSARRRCDERAINSPVEGSSYEVVDLSRGIGCVRL